MRRTGKEGLYARVVPKKRKQDESPQIDAEWGHCEECDPEFPCYSGPGCAVCARSGEDETKWDST